MLNTFSVIDIIKCDGIKIIAFDWLQAIEIKLHYGLVQIAPRSCDDFVIFHNQVFAECQLEPRRLIIFYLFYFCFLRYQL